MDKAEHIIKEILTSADITINGNRPWDIHVHDPRFYQRILTDGSLGFGESYMDKWWDCEALDEAIARIMRADSDKKLPKTLKLIAFLLQRRFFNIARGKRAYIVGQHHYDIGNELYQRMLDPDMNYSCGYWKGMHLDKDWRDPKKLTKAQQAKLDLICRKLQLQKGMKVLDIGSGWGNFARYAAQNYGVRVVGITVSKEQAKKAKERCKGLPVTFRVQDYREMKPELFDRVVSIGMFEHITHKNYETFMRIVDHCLARDGLFLLHCIGANVTTFANDPWNEKYIFPNSHVASLAQIAKSAEGKFIVEDMQNFGSYYYTTLLAWYENFTKHWKELVQLYPEKYTDRFYRMWTYYLLSCAGAFKCRSLLLFQIVFSKNNNLGVYEAVR